VREACGERKNKGQRYAAVLGCDLSAEGVRGGQERSESGSLP